MNEKDRDLGMDSDITRRDFLDGAARIIGGTALAAAVGPVDAAVGHAADNSTAPGLGADYPPLRQGLRGHNVEAMEAGHSIRDGMAYGEGADTGEFYDLVIVGAGLSGLAAAYFFRKHRPNAKILLLDACDDFGGHARRVEFDIDGRQLINNGGTLGLWYPNTLAPESAQMLEDIGVDRERYYKYTATDEDLIAKLGLDNSQFFHKERYKKDLLVPGRPYRSDNDPDKWRAFLARTPWSTAAKEGIVKLYTDTTDYMAGLPVAEKVRRLRKITHIDYLRNIANIHADAIEFIQQQGGLYEASVAAGPDTYSAWFGYRVGHRGFDGLGLPTANEHSDLTKDPGEHVFFPDGNAGIARLLLRWLIPDTLAGSTMEDSIPAHIRYDKLDVPTNDVRTRLSSTVTRVKHLGDPASAREVQITYVRAGRPYRVRGAATVMACFNAIIPYLMPELPETQKAALHRAVRKPIVYTSVALRNWRAFEKLGVFQVICPGMFYQTVYLEFKSGWGGAYNRPRTPDDPIVLTMDLASSVLEMHGSGLSPREQWKAARAKLQTISFETMERNIRSQLDRMLGPGGFNARRDIAGITVSRWGHGYAGGTNELWDPDYSHRTDAPWIVGRQRFGRVAIANSDAAATALTNAAFAQAHRAVIEIVNDVIRPTYDFMFSERDTKGPMGAFPEAG